MFKYFYIILLFCSSAFAENVLEKVDDYRGYNESFEMKVIVTDFTEEQIKAKFEFKVLVRDKSSSFLEYTAPNVDKGKKMLMKDDNVWFYSKSIEKPLRLSPSQKLLGGASNADVARANFSNDYIITKTSDTGNILKLYLKAKRGTSAYAFIILEVWKENLKPIKATFLTESEKVLKIAEYKEFKEDKVSKIEITDGISKLSKTTIEYQNYRIKKVPDHYFNPEFLSRIK